MTFEIIVIYLILILSVLSLSRLLLLYISTDIHNIYHKLFVTHLRLQTKNHDISFAVIIPAHNEEVVIHKTLQHVFKNKYKHYKVYIADDGSSDGTYKQVMKFKKQFPNLNLKHIYETNQGKAEALNNIIQNHVDEEIIMCLDADCLISATALEKATKYFRNPRVQALVSNVKIIPSFSFVNLVQRMEYLNGFYVKRGLDTLNLEYIIGGAGSMFRKSILDKVNYYDSDTITEDIDLSLKIINDDKDNLIVFAKDIIVKTQGPLSFRDLIKQRFRWKLGWMQTIYKNKSLIFNLSPKYNWLFTLYYLPYMIFSQLVSLLEPLFYVIVLSSFLVQGDYFPLIFIILFYYFTGLVTVLGDNSINLKGKLFFLAIMPFNFIALNIITCIEYVCLLKCFFNFGSIIDYKKNKSVNWQHVKRADL